MAAAGSTLNVQWGFEVDTTTILSVAGADVGMIDGSIVVRVPRTFVALRADQAAGPIDGTITTKDVFLTALTKEVLGANLADAWGAADYAGSSIVVNDTDKGEIAIILVTTGPDGATCTATIAKAWSIGEGTWTVPFAEAQTIEMEFQGIADPALSGQIMRVVHS